MRSRTVVIAPRAGWIPHLSELPQYRDLLASFVRRDMSLRYRQTLLGPIWIILQPLLGAGVFSFVFGRVAGIKIPSTVPYFLFTLVGMSLWFGVSSTLTRGTASILSNVDLVTKIYFPRVLLPLSASISTALDSALMAVLALVGLEITGHGPGWPVLLAPVIVGFTLAAISCISAALGALLVNYRDVGYGVPLLTQFLLFLTPVLYPMSVVPAALRNVVRLNPLATDFELLRWSVIDGPAPSGPEILYSALVLAALAALSLSVFSRLERDFADVI